jgi:hypothetical protein
MSTPIKYGFEYKILGWCVILFILTIAFFFINSKGIDPIIFHPKEIDSIRIENAILVTSKDDITRFSVVLQKSKKFLQCFCKGGYKQIDIAFYSRGNVSELRIEYHMDKPPRIRANDFEYSNDAFVNLVETILNNRRAPFVPTRI